ncbi:MULTISPECIES: hypothetical protein [Bradyrhizobium]|uniref:hypothetical protein n=1 Tax=Bradyrhizobium TaxID=374 RepID=UPI002FE37A1F
MCPISTLCIRRRHDEEAQLYAFDIIALGDKDLRQLPLKMRGLPPSEGRLVG